MIAAVETAAPEPRIRTIVLDLDGTMLDGQYRYYACYRQILEELGYSPVTPERYRRMRLERLDRVRLLATSGAEEIHEAFLRAWLERIEHPDLLALDRLRPGVIGQLRAWRDRNIRLVLATMRRYPARLDEQLDRLGLGNLFDLVVACGPRSESLGKAQQVAEAAPDLTAENCLWIGDTECDIEAARWLGCPVWAVAGGERTEACLQSLEPDFLSEGLSSIDLSRLEKTRSPHQEVISATGEVRAGTRRVPGLCN